LYTACFFTLKKNLVTFQSFNFEEAVLTPSASFSVPLTDDGTHPEPLRKWLDNQPRIAKSADGQAILLHLPQGLGKQGHVS
jgi:hypothetical protein